MLYVLFHKRLNNLFSRYSIFTIVEIRIFKCNDFKIHFCFTPKCFGQYVQFYAIKNGVFLG